MKRYTCLFIAVLAFVAACRQSEEKVTKPEAEKFAASMEQAALKHRPDLITGNLLMQAFGDRIKKENNFKYAGTVEEGLKTGFKNSDFDKNVYDIMGEYGSFEKVKVYEENGIQRVIFRIHGDNGFNYFDAELSKLDDKVGIADMMLYSSGENLSKSMADILSKMLSGLGERSAEQASESLQGIERLMAKKNYEQAKKEFDDLPARIKNTRLADMISIQIAANIDNETYIKESERLEKKYAGEPQVQLTLLDLYFLRKDYDKALWAVDQLDSLINKDPFLDYYRGLIYNAKEESEKAAQHFKLVTENLPDFPGGYIELTSHYLNKDDTIKAKMYFSKYKTLRNSNPKTIHTYETVYPVLKEE